MFPCACVNFNIPKSSKIPLSYFSVTVGIRPCLHDCLFGRAQSGLSSPTKSLCFAQKPFPPFYMNCSSFNTCHMYTISVMKFYFCNVSLGIGDDLLLLI